MVAHACHPHMGEVEVEVRLSTFSAAVPGWHNTLSQKIKIKKEKKYLCEMHGFLIVINILKH